MSNHTKRIYMTEVDGSPGSGTPPPPAPAAPPATPPAPETPPPAVTVDQVKSLMTEMLGGFKNEFFANARRAGLLKKDETPPPPPTPPSGAAPAAVSLADIESMLERERVVTRVATEHKLTDAQVKRMKTMIAAEKPEDVSGWVSAFVTDMGLVRTTEQPATTPVPPVPQPQPNGHPISDKGSPAPGGIVNWEREFAENPIGMSAAARSAMDAKHGREKAVKMRLDAAQIQAARIKVTTAQQG